MANIINIIGLTKKFASVTALEDINIDISEKEVFGIVGESGSGKTTLSRLVLNLIKPDAGSVIYKGVNIFSMSKEDERKYRDDVQIVFQNPYTSLNPRMRIGDILKEPLIIRGQLNKVNEDSLISGLLLTVGLKKSFKNKYPHELSGGERQRVGIARALSVKPKVLVLDEPVSSLDVSIQAQILNLLKGLRVKFNLTYIFVSHDLSVINYLCDRVAVLKNGKLIEVDDTKKIFSDPKSSYVKKLIASIPKLFD